MSRGEDLFFQWIAPGSLWSPWHKPVLFAQIPGMVYESVAAFPSVDAPWESVDTSWAPPVSQRTALIVDLPAEQPLLAGTALAAKGYQPVVLYNCCPGPSPVLDLNAVMAALIRCGDALTRTPRPRHDAPPAFLLDSRRAAGDRQPMPGLFDNRWVVLPQDFPSGTFLRANGIERVLLVHDRNDQPREDLAHVLLRWQGAGIHIDDTKPGGTPAELRVARPSRFRAAWYTFLVTFGLRANSAGGFGSLLPVASPGGG